MNRLTRWFLLAPFRGQPSPNLSAKPQTLKPTALTLENRDQVGSLVNGLFAAAMADGAMSEPVEAIAALVGDVAMLGAMQSIEASPVQGSNPTPKQAMDTAVSIALPISVATPPASDESSASRVAPPMTFLGGPLFTPSVSVEDLLPSDSGVTLHGSPSEARPVAELPNAGSETFAGARNLESPSATTMSVDWSPAEQELRPGTTPRSGRASQVEPNSGTNPTPAIDPQYGPDSGGSPAGSMAFDEGGGGPPANLTVGERPELRLEAIDWTASEGGGTGAFRLTREGTLNQENVSLLVSGSASKGVDYTLSANAAINPEWYGADMISVTFAEGENIADITVTPIDDGDYEGPEAVTLSLMENYFTIESYSGEYVSATVSINDDDDPALSSTPTSVPSLSVTAVADGNGVGSDGAFMLSRSGGFVGESLLVDYSVGGTASNGGDYTELYGTALFNAGESTTGIRLEALSTPSDAKTVVVSNLTLSDSKPSTVVGPGFAVANITNGSDQAGRGAIVRVAASRDKAYESGLPGEFTFSRIGADLSGALSVGYTLGGSATSDVDYILSGTATFQPYASTTTVIVSAIEDNSNDSPETVVVSLTGGTHTLVDPSHSSATVTIEDTFFIGGGPMGFSSGSSLGGPSEEPGDDEREPCPIVIGGGGGPNNHVAPDAVDDPNITTDVNTLVTIEVMTNDSHGCDGNDTLLTRSQSRATWHSHDQPL